MNLANNTIAFALILSRHSAVKSQIFLRSLVQNGERERVHACVHSEEKRKNGQEIRREGLATEFLLRGRRICLTELESTWQCYLVTSKERINGTVTSNQNDDDDDDDEVSARTMKSKNVGCEKPETGRFLRCCSPEESRRVKMYNETNIMGPNVEA